MIILDRHKTIENYGAIKQRIYQHCTYALYNRNDNATIPNACYGESQTLSFGSDASNGENFGLAEINGVHHLMSGEKRYVHWRITASRYS